MGDLLGVTVTPIQAYAARKEYLCPGCEQTIPTGVFPTKDGYFYLAAGNDGQYARFCEFAGVPELATDPRFDTNPKRLVNPVP